MHMPNIFSLLTVLGRFILSPEYQWLLNKFSTTSLRAIHTSLAIEDRLAAFIRAERIKQYPEGTDLLGISCAYTRHILR
jgi:hypothetical protein